MMRNHGRLTTHDIDYVVRKRLTMPQRLRNQKYIVESGVCCTGDRRGGEGSSRRRRESAHTRFERFRHGDWW
jgi:hypothetical protein